MFQIGDYVMYKTDGVCKVDQITTMEDFHQNKQKKLYYVLVPIKDSGIKIYSAVDNTQIPRRLAMTEKEAREMVDSMTEIPVLKIENEKYREDCYKKALKSGDCKEWIRIVKTIYLRRQGRLAEGKKSTAIDDYYLNAAEQLVLAELSFSMGMTADEIQKYIEQRTK